MPGSQRPINRKIGLPEIPRGWEAAENNAKCGVFYRHMIDHVKKVLGDIPRVVPGYAPRDGYDLAGFVWFQGLQ